LGIVHGGETKLVQVGQGCTLYAGSYWMALPVPGVVLYYEGQCSRGDINCVHKPVYLPGFLIQSCITQAILLHLRQFCWWFWRLCIRAWTG